MLNEDEVKRVGRKMMTGKMLLAKFTYDDMRVNKEREWDEQLLDALKPELDEVMKMERAKLERALSEMEGE